MNRATIKNAGRGLLLAAGLMGLTAAHAADKARVIVGFDKGGKAAVAQSLRGQGAEFHHDLSAVDAFAVTLPSQALNGLRNNPNVVYIEEDVKRHQMAQVAPYGIAMVQADQVSDANGGSRMICIIDSGIDASHEDHQGNNLSGTNDSGTGNWYEDGNGHGTHVAGTIAAVNNGLGVVGVMPNQNVAIHIIKVFDASGWAYSSSLVNAATECENAGANVISMSLGGSFSSNTEDNYFSQADNRGVLSIAAAGNDGNTRHSYPASYDAVVSVAAIDSSKNVASFSQQTDQVELAAPGVGVKSTVPMGTGSATEMSVAGVGYEAIPMEGSPSASGTGALVDCGLGESTCSGASGAVCLIERGNISFADKVLACQNGGGVGAVIFNNESGSLNGTLGGTSTSIPSVGITQTDGQYLQANELGSTATVATGAGNYAFFDGTSMATPHVSGVAALVWSQHLGCSNSDIRNALNATAEDLGDPGRDNAYGYGLVQAKAAVDHLAAQPCGGGSTNNPPAADFAYSCTDLSCDFDGSGSSDSDGTIVTYSWDFGDGNTAGGMNASHSFGSDGTYTVSLTVTDDAGATDTTSQSVTVSSGTVNQPPNASFTNSCTDLACDFDGSGSSDSDGSIVSYSWDFGDGNTGSGQAVSHSFGSDGTYTVSLTVTDDAGATDTTSQDVTVSGGDTGGEIVLQGTGYKVKGRHHIDLSWSGATSTNVDIYRNGSLIDTTANDGAYTDATNNRGWGVYDYQVCEAGTSTCSATVTVNI